MNVFKDYSQYYNLLYQDKPYQKEVEYLTKLINKFNANTKSILELGCGTGKHAELLSKNGYLIHGIDISQTMLDQALKIANNKISFEIGDVRNYRANKKFDTVISLFHVASYQNSNQDLNDFFNTANIHLKNQGIFIFDAWYGPAVLNQKPEKRKKILENNHLKIIRDCDPEIDFNKNIVNVNYQITITNKENNQQHNFKEQHKMRYLFLNEVELLLNINNMKLLDFHEFLSENTASQHSWGVCFIAKKN